MKRGKLIGSNDVTPWKRRTQEKLGTLKEAHIEQGVPKEAHIEQGAPEEAHIKRKAPEEA